MTNEEITETILSREKETKNTKRLRAFIQKALTLKDAEFLEFLENELWHLENQLEEIKITIRNIKQKIKELKE